MIRAALLALLLALPARAAEDFSERNTCYWLTNVFTNDTLATGKLDHCTTGAQKGSNDLICISDTNVTVEIDTAPPGSPAGADSLDYDGGNAAICQIDADTFASSDFGVGGWFKFDNMLQSFWIGRFGDSGSDPGKWHFTRRSSGGNGKLRSRTDGTWSPADSGDGVPIPNDTWAFIGWSHDAGTGSGTMRIYSSESTIANTLFDCTGGSQACSVEATPMSGDEIYYTSGDTVASKTIDGDTYEHWFLAEAPSEQEFCQACRCGFQNDVRGVGRVDVCNRCIVPDYQGCRRVID